MFVQPGETFERRLDVLCGNVTNFLGLENTDEPPIAVTVVHQEETVAFDDVRLSLHDNSEAVQRVDEVKVDGFVWNG